MSYMVMECHCGYAILLDEEGRFLKAANFQYEVGQTVENPVFMAEKAPRVHHITRWVTGGVAALAACLLLLVGMGYYQDYLVPYSSIYLSINPAVQMELNRKGTVVSLSGANEDGITLLDGYQGKGKDKVTVADELIDRAIEMGFLSEGGQVSFSIDAPDDALFQEYGVELRSKLSEHLDGRMTITIEITDYHTRENPTPTPAPSPSPSPSARPAVSSQASRPAVAPPVTSGGDNNGDTDYSDTDYGPNNDGDTDYTPPVADEDDDDDDSEYTDGSTGYGPQNTGPEDDDFDDDDYSDDDYGDDNDEDFDSDDNDDND